MKKRSNWPTKCCTATWQTVRVRVYVEFRSLVEMAIEKDHRIAQGWVEKRAKTIGKYIYVMKDRLG